MIFTHVFSHMTNYVKWTDMPKGVVEGPIFKMPSWVGLIGLREDKQGTF